MLVSKLTRNSIRYRDALVLAIVDEESVKSIDSALGIERPMSCNVWSVSCIFLTSSVRVRAALP